MKHIGRPNYRQQAVLWLALHSAVLTLAACLFVLGLVLGNVWWTQVIIAIAGLIAGVEAWAHATYLYDLLARSWYVAAPSPGAVSEPSSWRTPPARPRIPADGAAVAAGRIVGVGAGALLTVCPDCASLLPNESHALECPQRVEVRT